MAVYHGQKGRVLISTTGTGTASSVLSLTEWSLNMPTDRVETTAFADTNKTYVQGLRDISGAFSGFYNDAETKLFAAATSADGIKMYLYPDLTNAPTKFAAGPAWLDVSITTGVAAAVAVSGSFAATGAWTVNL
jgi:hypothetical protein